MLWAAAVNRAKINSRRGWQIQNNEPGSTITPGETKNVGTPKTENSPSRNHCQPLLLSQHWLCIFLVPLKGIQTKNIKLRYSGDCILLQTRVHFCLGPVTRSQSRVSAVSLTGLSIPWSWNEFRSALSLWCYESKTSHSSVLWKNTRASCTFALLITWHAELDERSDFRQEKVIT